ncbi:rCG27198 [Rattus norvegicus]|uniref:RCG27198 n=1 Tax=Rattus norvegicus TaxID=10116 RepID=A6HMB9_RAT|nr:rCG27198 [Rattus norvegicus]
MCNELEERTSVTLKNSRQD